MVFTTAQHAHGGTKRGDGGPRHCKEAEEELKDSSVTKNGGNIMAKKRLLGGWSSCLPAQPFSLSRGSPTEWNGCCEVIHYYRPTPD